ncbi:MAG: hypothetical protein ACI4K7_05325 [Oscillospiraceae bacterium]
MLSVTVRKDKAICAFCKNWYDPMNQYIKPRFPQNNIWYYDSNAKCKCLVNGMMRMGNNGSCCKHFECKVNIN